MVAWQSVFDGPGFLPSSVVPCVLPLDAFTSGHSSVVLDDILVDSPLGWVPDLEKGTVKFYCINKSSFESFMCNEYDYVPKGTKDGVSQHVSVCEVTYSIVALLDPLVLNYTR
ncbi:hypothetical protein DSO57_1008339 [Entomophthora muscae]|uniref:Uncharacterized protein n=1 Tax=Entomophthora muscae TaxID=34485 RepID=A0ACC2S8T3_9FUNG|nr:hypothetical protein DSO57_1008339 [Entomophthora muscae]